MRYGIDDIRHLNSGDLRFLHQFKIRHRGILRAFGHLRLKFSFFGYGAGRRTPSAELMHLITLKTAECEGLEETGAHARPADEARIVTVEKLGKNAMKVMVATANHGIKTVVCGAPNCRPGLRTVYVPLGKKDH